MNYKEIEEEFDEKFCGYMADGRLHFIKPDMDGTAIKSFLKAKINKVIDECIGKKEYLMWENRCEDCKSKDIYQSDCPKCNSIEKGYKQKVRELKEYKKEFNKLST